MCVCGGQNCLLPTMDMAKVGGPLSAVKVWTSMQSIGKWVAPIGCDRTNLNIPCPLPATLVFRLFCRLLIYHHISVIIYANAIYEACNDLEVTVAVECPLIHLMHLDAERT